MKCEKVQRNVSISPKIYTFFESKELLAMDILAEKLHTGRTYFFPILNGHGNNKKCKKKLLQMKFHETVSMANNIRFGVKRNVLTLGNCKGSKRKDQDCDFI